MDIGDIADGSTLNNFDDSPIVIASMDLSTKLSGDAFFGGGFSDEPSFSYSVREWLFTVNVFASVDGSDAGRGVMMISGSDGHRIELVSFDVEHFSVVGVGAGLKTVFLFEHVLRSLKVSSVNVAEGNDVVGHHSFDISGSPIGCADTGDVKFFKRASTVLSSGSSDVETGSDRSGSGRLLQEKTTILFAHEETPIGKATHVANEASDRGVSKAVAGGVIEEGPTVRGYAK